MCFLCTLTELIKHTHIVSACTLYGGTYCQFKVSLPRLGIQVKFAKDDDPASFDILVDDKTRALYVETLGNPKVCTVGGGKLGVCLYLAAPSADALKRKRRPR